jgi:hypothetical protein
MIAAVLKQGTGVEAMLKRGTKVELLAKQCSSSAEAGNESGVACEAVLKQC